MDKLTFESVNSFVTAAAYEGVPPYISLTLLRGMIDSYEAETTTAMWVAFQHKYLSKDLELLNSIANKKRIAKENKERRRLLKGTKLSTIMNKNYN